MVLRSSLLLSVLFALTLAASAFAQQSGDQTAQPPGSPQKATPEAQKPMPPLTVEATPVPGRPDIPNAEIMQKLRNVAPLPFGAPADKLPTAELKVPKGFKVDVYASGIPNARSLRIGDKGTVFVSNRVLDKVYAVVDKNGKREAKVIASGLDRPNGLAFHQGTLYIAEGTRISKLEKIEDNLDNPPKPVVIYSDFLNHQSHGWKFMGLGPDNKLYVNVGSPCNICEPPATNGQIRRISLDGSSADVVARGVRNSVGFDWHPVTKELYFTDNGRDWLGDDQPPDELNRLGKVGEHFGYPYCHGAGLRDPEFNRGRACSEFTPPARELGPHVASLGMRFYTGATFPEKYRGGIFIAEHGSWNRSKPIGYRVTFVNDAKGQVAKYEPFAEGWLRGDRAWGRPVDVEVMPDGALLVSDDELAKRRAARPVREPKAERGYLKLFLESVTQADQGVDFDFLRKAK